MLIACGSDDSGKISRGHRDAIKFECAEDSNEKLCASEVKKKFTTDGNEFVNLSELNKDQLEKVKMECVRSKKYGLESYNNCLLQYNEAALDGTLTALKIAKKPKDNIEDLEKSVVLIEITEFDDNEKEDFYVVYAGSGVILDKNYIATNCHVALEGEKNSKRLIMINNLSDRKNRSIAKIYKKNPGKDVCILKHQPKGKHSISMNPVRKIQAFSNLKRGDFVRTLGTPHELAGHTASGSINYLGDSKSSVSWLDENTKLIFHDATIDEGSSGGPLFDKNGYLIGLNTGKAGNFYFSVSSDHILEMMK